MDYDKFINISSWVAAIGLIISAIGVFAFRYYTGKKNAQSFAGATEHRNQIKDSLDIEFEKT